MRRGTARLAGERRTSSKDATVEFLIETAPESVLVKLLEASSCLRSELDVVLIEAGAAES